MYHSRSVNYFIVSMLLFMSVISNAMAIEPSRDLTSPTLKPTIPIFETPRVKAISVGIIKSHGTTSYMYGTHVLVNDNGKTLYALRSNNIELDRHVGRKVKVSGYLIKGYPVDGGPDFLDVESIE
jgi:hypothetical protein